MVWGGEKGKGWIDRACHNTSRRGLCQLPYSVLSPRAKAELILAFVPLNTSIIAPAIPIGFLLLLAGIPCWSQRSNSWIKEEGESKDETANRMYLNDPDSSLSL